MSLRRYLPLGAVPKTRFSDRPPSAWLAADSEARFQDDPAPLLPADAIEYRFNSEGYRTAEFSDRPGLNVICIGGNETLGVGLPLAATYPACLEARLSERLGRTIQVWNLSTFRASNDFVARTLLAAVPYFEPAAVFVNWQVESRREFLAADGRLLAADPENKPPAKRRIFRSLEDRISESVAMLNNPCNNRANLIRNFNLVRFMLAAHGSTYCYATAAADDFNFVSECLDPEHYLGTVLENDRGARDRQHPGTAAHNAFADRLAARLLPPLRRKGADGPEEAGSMGAGTPPEVSA